MAEHRTALVAGGTGALGSHVVTRLLERGYRVCVPYVDEEGAGRLRQQRADDVAEGRLRVTECDVTDPDAVAALLDVLRADWGPLWLACSTVGGWAGGTPLSELDDLTLFERMLRLNLRSATVVAREGLRHMGPDGGRIVLVSARQALEPSAGEAAYGAAKAAVLSLVGTLAEELRGSGVTANAVLPRMIDTPANRAAMPDADHSAWTPPEAIAEVMVWLAGDEAGPISGAGVPVYGQA